MSAVEMNDESGARAVGARDAQSYVPVASRRRRILTTQKAKARSTSPVATLLIAAALASLVGVVLYLIYRKMRDGDEKKAASPTTKEEYDTIQGLPSQEEIARMSDAEKHAAVERILNRQRIEQNIPSPSVAVNDNNQPLSASSLATGSSSASVTTTTSRGSNLFNYPPDHIWYKLKALCPAPNQILEVGTSGRYHCYKPCPVGFESIIIDPDAENEERIEVSLEDVLGNQGNNGTIPVEPYLGCRAVCPDPVAQDAGSGKSACKRKYQSRDIESAIGSGEDIVKCPWIPDGTDYAHDVNNKTQDCSSPGKSYECAKGRSDTTWYGGSLNGKFCSLWAKKAVWADKDKKFTTVPTAACGKDYELLPYHSSAFFDKHLTLETNKIVVGDNRDQGMRCAKMCPPGSEMIPTGPLEIQHSACAEACPLNTRVDDTKPSLCVKDGFKRPIALYDMQKITDLSK